MVGKAPGAWVLGLFPVERGVDELTLPPAPLPDLHVPGLPSLASLLPAPPAAGAQYPESQLPNQHSPQGRLEGALGHPGNATNAANQCTGARG